jgi:two-component system, response regulator PdtaR
MKSSGVQTLCTIPAPQPGAKAVPNVGTRTRHRILIVEDNIFVAHQCQCALTKAGYEVIDVVTTADQAVERAMQRRPDMVLMDIYLPGTRDGVAAALEIFERSGIRSIFASALSDPGMQARATLTRPLAWLPKPFSDQKLVAIVNAALRELDSPSEPASASWASVASTESRAVDASSHAVVARGG